MNDPGLLSIVAWRTQNRKRQAQAEHFSKNYGLSKLHPALYVGRLSSGERREFEEKMVSLLSGKRDRLHLFASCKSCAMNSNANEIITEHYQEKFFEIV